MSLGATPLPWSAEQQEWLSALGYSVLTLGSAADVEASAPVSAAGETEAAPAPQAPARPAAPARARAPALADETVDAAPAPAVRAAARPRTGARLPDRLHLALIRASGMNPNAEGAAEVFAQWPSSAELRGNAAAKRALWPRLRALRKSSQA